MYLNERACTVHRGASIIEHLRDDIILIFNRLMYRAYIKLEQHQCIEQLTKINIK